MWRERSGSSTISLRDAAETAADDGTTILTYIQPTVNMGLIVVAEPLLIDELLVLCSRPLEERRNRSNIATEDVLHNFALA